MRAAAFLLAIVLTGCGYVGDPQPPALNIPLPAEGFRAIQLGGKIVVEFQQSAATTEGLTLAKLGPPQVEIAGETFEIPNAAPGPVRFEVDAGKWIGQTLPVRVRVNNGRGRYSGWSSAATLNVVEPLKTPGDVRASSTGEGVRLTWVQPEIRPGLQWRVTRTSKEGGRSFEATSQPFIDADAQLGVEYSYRVQAIVASAQSLSSEAVVHSHVDRKAPSAPTGLSASLTLDAVELTWVRNPEEDVATYRIYRDTGDGWKVLADALKLPAFSDRVKQPTGAERTRRYRVTAIDLAGNESEPSGATAVPGN